MAKYELLSVTFYCDNDGVSDKMGWALEGQTKLPRYEKGVTGNRLLPCHPSTSDNKNCSPSTPVLSSQPRGKPSLITPCCLTSVTFQNGGQCGQTRAHRHHWRRVSPPRPGFEPGKPMGHDQQCQDRALQSPRGPLGWRSVVPSRPGQEGHRK
jgi:hypothetical protein